MVRYLISLAANIYVIILIARWVIEMALPQFVNTGWFLKVRDITEPLLEWIRKLVPPVKGIDFSYLIAVIGVTLTSRIIIMIL